VISNSFRKALHFLGAVKEILVDSLFPLSPLEKEVLSLSPESALQKLPRAPSPPVPNTRSVFAYKDERVTKLIWALKYKKSAAAARIAARTISDFAVKPFSGTISQIADAPKKILILPMPITPRRRRERGYNQCELLVDEIKKLHPNRSHSESVGPTSPQSPAAAPNLIFSNNLLIRTHHTSRQTLKGRAERIESAKGLFEVNNSTKEQLTHKLNLTEEELLKIPVLIIDDVITTGSTIKEAIETMQHSGFQNVSGLSLAH
jgi:predicted amidophosphoribosyltransferase